MTRRDLTDDVDEIHYDLLFLPPPLAERLLGAWQVSSYPLVPIFDLHEVSTSIKEAYLGANPFEIVQHPDLSLERIFKRCRNLLVLAIGAQIEAGDGDAQLPRQVAGTWSRALFAKAEKILTSLVVKNAPSAYMVKSWLLVARYYEHAGLIEGESSHLTQMSNRN